MANANQITDEEIETVARAMAGCAGNEGEWRSHANDAKIAIATYRACAALRQAEEAEAQNGKDQPKGKVAKSFAEIKDDIKGNKASPT